MLSAGAYSFRQKSRLAISLTWIAGYTNIVAFLVVGGVVTSHVTGNVTHFGRAVADLFYQHKDAGHSTAPPWRQLLFFGFVVFAFFAGAAASAVMTELARRRGTRSKYMVPMAVEALLLTALGVGIALHAGGQLDAGVAVHHYWLTGVAACAMGLQNATITRISGNVIRTTHLTGVLTDLGLEGVQYLLWLRDRSRRRESASASHPSRLGRVWKLSRRNAGFLRLLLLTSIIGSFLFGVVAGTLMFYRFEALAMPVPVLFLLWICWVDWRKPIADVRELDPSTDPDLGGHAWIKSALPAGVGLYRLAHHRKDAAHHAPDFAAWVDRLPEHWRVVILVVSPLTHFDGDAALDLSAAVQRLRSQRRDLILCGVKPVQYKALARGGLIDLLGPTNLAPDLEMAVARAMNLVTDAD
jgi:uncharacterized membrane protein YoaK (UPF0700 family)/anti-anti-sigma regulatory factor